MKFHLPRSDAETRDMPMLAGRVPAGFPSPAADYVETTLDLNEHLVHRPAATFFVRIEGESMTDAGIHSGDLVIVDRSLTPRAGDIVIAALDGELTIKRLGRQGDRLFLMPENSLFDPIPVEDGDELVVWGVVTAVIRSLR